jgi:hypothetical protein
MLSNTCACKHSETAVRVENMQAAGWMSMRAHVWHLCTSCCMLSYMCVCKHINQQPVLAHVGRSSVWCLMCVRAHAADWVRLRLHTAVQTAWGWGAAAMSVAATCHSCFHCCMYMLTTICSTSLRCTVASGAVQCAAAAASALAPSQTAATTAACTAAHLHTRYYLPHTATQCLVLCYMQLQLPQAGVPLTVYVPHRRSCKLSC